VRLDQVFRISLEAARLSKALIYVGSSRIAEEQRLIEASRSVVNIRTLTAGLDSFFVITLTPR
jgi:hypothetical protein